MANVLPIFKDGFTPYRQKTHDNESKGSIYDRCFFSYIYIFIELIYCTTISILPIGTLDWW